MLKEFRDFMMRGNIIAVAIALAMALAFNKVVDAFAVGFITPLVGLLWEDGISGFGWTWRGSHFDLGLILNAIIVFVVTAVAIFFLIVKPLTKMGFHVDGDKETP